MQQNDIGKSMRNFVIKVLVTGALILAVANGMYMFMTWLFERVVKIQSVYLRSEYKFLSTGALCIIILIIIFIFNYRKRKRELTILSENIERVARGDYSSKIEYKKRDSMANIYRDFNKMSAELSSVAFLKSDFINNYSHEFKTPLASINGFASLMLEKDLDPAMQKEFLTIIRDESDRLTKLTSDTILLSKLSSQEYLSTTEEFDLGEQLRQCSIILSHQWLEKKQIFSGEFPKVNFLGNRELMQHLWLNIIGNAIKYTPIGGEISVTLSQNKETGKIKVVITDTGEGMDEATLAHLFMPYYQGESRQSRQGLGLGLAISKHIVDLCEGEIHVDSKPDEGSSFTIELPEKTQGKADFFRIPNLSKENPQA